MTTPPPAPDLRQRPVVINDFNNDRSHDLQEIPAGEQKQRLRTVTASSEQDFSVIHLRSSKQLLPLEIRCQGLICTNVFTEHFCNIQYMKTEDNKRKSEP